MRITYQPSSPDRGDPKTWIIDPKRIPASEAELLEKHYGDRPWDLLVRHAQQGNTAARRLILWYCMRQDHPRAHANLRDVPDFFTGELLVESSPAELVEMRDQVVKSRALTESELEVFLAQWQTEYDDAVEAEAGSALTELIAGHDQPAAGAPPMPTPVLRREGEEAPPETPLPSAPSPTFGGATG